MMFRQICIFLTSMAVLQSAAMAADFGSSRGPAGGRIVPGADVTIEAGVRVIRPVPFDPAWVVDDEAEIPGGVVYRGAAFYRVPGASAAKTIPKAKPQRQQEE